MTETVLPRTVFVTRKIVCDAYGVTAYMLRKAASAGLIHPVKPAGCRYARYLGREIERVYGRTQKEGGK